MEKKTSMENFDIIDAFNKKTYIKRDHFIFEFMDIPSEIVKSVDFMGMHMISITFLESAEFCVEKYFSKNFDVLKGKKMFLRYINNEGVVIRTDEYVVSELHSMIKDSLDETISDYMKIKIVLEYSEYDISTCKE